MKKLILCLIFLLSLSLLYRILNAKAEFLIRGDEKNPVLLPPKSKSLESNKKDGIDRGGHGTNNIRSEIRPKYKIKEPIVEAEIPEIIEKLISCESGGRSIEIMDTNGKMSRGILMWQDESWNAVQSQFGFIGDPMNPDDAKKATFYALKDGQLWRWKNCAKKYKFL